MQIKCNLTQGEKLTVMDALIDPDTLEIVPRTRKCTVIREYPKFILADFGVYLRFTETSGHHSVLERPFSETKQPPIFTRNDGTLNVY